jgi:DNA polymerase-1
MVRADELFLIDSTFLFKASEAAFLGAPLLVDEEGRDHTRTFGVMRDLLRLRRMLGMRRAIVLVGEESVAATHKDVLDDVIPLLRQIGACVLREDGSRVVDVCGQVGCSAQWIVSMNPAMQQLIADGLGVIIPHAGSDIEVVTRDRLNETGMRPVWVPAVLALSDGENAPLKRRQALRLLEIYGSLETVLDDASSAPSADWKRKLAPNAVGLLQVERDLQSWPVAIASPVPIDETSFIDDSEASTTALQAYGFWSLVRMLPAPEPIEIGDPTFGEGNKTDYGAVRSAEDLRRLEQCLANADVCAIDTETSGKDPRTATLYGVSLAVREGQAFYVPLIQSDLDGLRLDDVRARLKVALSRRLKLVGHNLKYDFAVLHRHGIDVQELHFDTLLAAHECFGDWDFWNLSALAKKLLGAKVLRYREIVAKGETFLGRPFKELVEHACCDADMALRLYEVLTKELRKRGAEKQFADRAMRVERLLVERERDGVRIDVGRMRAAGRATKVRAETMRAAVIAAAGCEFDVDSPRSTTETLRKLGIWEKTSRPLGEAQMEQIAGDYPLVAKIVRYRREKRRSRDIGAICAAARKGRIYPLLSQCKFVDDSLWSASPALEEAFAASAVLDKAVEGLHTEAGRCLKVLAEAADDAVLRNDLGARKETDSLIPDVSVVGDREQREAVLLIAIGQPLPVLSRRFLIGRAEAAKLRSAITSRYPALFRWLQEFKGSALASGFAEYRGRRKYLAGLRSSDLDKRNRALRAAVRWLATHPASDGGVLDDESGVLRFSEMCG